MRGAALALFGLLAVVHAEGGEEEEEVVWGAGGELDADNFADMVSDDDWKPWAVLFSDGDATKDVAAVFADLADKSTDMLSFGEVDTTTPEGAARIARASTSALVASMQVRVSASWHARQSPAVYLRQAAARA